MRLPVKVIRCVLCMKKPYELELSNRSHDARCPAMKWAGQRWARRPLPPLRRVGWTPAAYAAKKANLATVLRDPTGNGPPELLGVAEVEGDDAADGAATLRARRRLLPLGWVPRVGDARGCRIGQS